MFIADLLSRLHLHDTVDTQLEDIYSISTECKLAAEIERVNMIKHIPISDERIRSIQQATKDDVEMQEIIRFIVDGFPSDHFST